MKWLFKFIILITFISCNETKDKDTLLLEQYIQNTFKQTIKKEATKYIVVSSSACGGCMTFLTAWIAEHPHNDEYIFIVPKNFKKHLSTIPSYVWIDSMDYVSKLKFHMGNIGKINTSNGKVINYKYYEPYEMSQIFDDAFK